MTVLAAIQAAAPFLGVEVPTAVYGSTEREHVELGAVANEVLREILSGHEWTLLKTLETINGDGSTTEFSLPSDYLRMPEKQSLWHSGFETPLTHVIDHDAWLEYIVKEYNLTLPIWTILGGSVQINPAPSSGVTVRYYYISNLAVAPDSGSNKAQFTADTDAMRICQNPDELLKLGIIWRWRLAKGLDVGPEAQAYRLALAQEIAWDKGARKVSLGRPRHMRGAKPAYPQDIVS